MDRVPHLRLKAGTYYYDHGRDATGKRRWQRLSRDRAEALRLWADIEAAKEAHQRNTVAALIDEYKATRLHRLAPATQRDYRNSLAVLTQAFGHMLPGDLQPAHIGRFLELHRSPSSANKQVAILSAVLGYGVRTGWLTDNVARRVQKNRLPKHDRYIEDWEFLAVKSVASAHMQAVMDLAYVTGLRQGDLLALRTDQFRDGWLLVRHHKTGYKHRIHVTEELSGIVARLRNAKSDYVICNRRGERIESHAFQQRWQRLMRDVMARRILTQRFSFHDIRAKAATDADELGLNAQRLLGHTSAAQTARYIRHKKPTAVQPLSLITGD